MLRNTTAAFNRRAERLSRLSAAIADMANDARSNPALQLTANRLEEAAHLVSQAADSYTAEA